MSTDEYVIFARFEYCICVYTPHERRQCLVFPRRFNVTHEHVRDASINIDKEQRDLLTRLTLTSGFQGDPM